MGHLQIKENLPLGVMSWCLYALGGYNFEDAIVISERVVKEDILTPIHIEEFEVEACDTKQGKEEITVTFPM